ncbi:hypothetical protein OMB55_00008160 [gamma proteobacterium HIMB55]|nr:hypothetical protein OMB55_00008160 [gamma proteobacterium HIMB55]
MGNASLSGWWLSEGTTLMSMILEAMKRSKEGETKTSDVPTVDTVHYVPEPESRFSRWQVGGMLAGVVVISAVALTAMWPSEPISGTAAASTTSSATPSAELVKTPASISQEADPPAERGQAPQLKAVKSVTAKVPPSYAREQPLSEAAATQTSALKTSQDVTPTAAPVSVPAQREGPIVTKSTPPSGRVMPQATQPVTSPDELRAIYQALNEEASQTAVTDESSASSDGGESGADNSVSSISQASDEAPPIDFADILAAAQEELGVKPLVESSEPLLETLSQQIKDDIPSLIYSEHRYDPAGSSSVKLNGKTVKERQRVGAFTVIEILPDSVVIRWRETQFRVRARNSWVNM